ncbi:MAG: hypothetical protein ACI8VT_003333, partial [Saprospiraceae bacterium]
TMIKNSTKAKGVRIVARIKDRFLTLVRYSRCMISQSLFILID